jgi:hypothetical protein
MRALVIKIREAFRFAKAHFWAIDWKLLLFLLLFLNVKLYCKVIAIALIYLFRFNFKFGFGFRSSRLPLFYLIAMGIAVFNWLWHKQYPDFNYDLVFVAGIGFWIFCILAIHQLKLSVESSKPHILANTIVAFFIINAIVSFLNILGIIIETGTLNPYQFQGFFQKYFIGTGDYIKGICFDTSTTNAIINVFGVVFFLFRRQIAMTMICMVVLLLTGSNFTNLIIVIVLAYIFIFQSNRIQKSAITICLFLVILFLARVSPQNYQYLVGTLKKTLNKKDVVASVPSGKTLAFASGQKAADLQAKELQIATDYIDSVNNRQPQEVSSEELINNRTIKTRPAIPRPDINSREYQSSSDTTVYQRGLLAFAENQSLDSAFGRIARNSQGLPGKIIAVGQTIHFLNLHRGKIFTGDGMGNFSSKLAFRVTALNMDGGYPVKRRYISPEFKENHLALYLYYFIRRSDFHSIINTPDSVYDQLLSEYGVIGVLSFLVFYFGYFGRHMVRSSYSLPLLIILAGVFLLGYWFEQLSVVVIFELLVLFEMKTKVSVDFAKRKSR